MADRTMTVTIATSNYKAPVRIKREQETLTQWYLNEEQKNIDVIKSALINNNFYLIANMGSNLYGHGATYGFNYISKIGKNIQTAATKKDFDSVYCLIDCLETYLQNVEIHYV